jgi:hypothetical protein
LTVRYSAVTGSFLLAFATLGSITFAQDGPSDLTVAVRSATGSDSFHTGDPVNLDLVFSSTAPHHYFEPCGRTAAADGGNAQDCEFFNSLSFSIAPVGGSAPPLVFIDHPPLGAPDRYLSAKPVSFPYLLTQTFRFQQPGDYRVQLKITIGLESKRAPHKVGSDSASDDLPSLTLTREITLHIVPAP